MTAHPTDDMGALDRPRVAPGLARALCGLLLLGAAAAGCGGSEPARRAPDYSSAFEREESTAGGFAELDHDGLPPDDEAVEPVDFPSCDEAREHNPETIDLANRGSMPPDVTVGEYARLLGRGSYLEECGVPPSVEIEVCAAVLNGRAVGISVAMSPHRQRIVNCVVEAIRALAFPSHPRLDVARTAFAPSP